MSEIRVYDMSEESVFGGDGDTSPVAVISDKGAVRGHEPPVSELEQYSDGVDVLTSEEDMVTIEKTVESGDVGYLFAVACAIESPYYVRSSVVEGLERPTFGSTEDGNVEKQRVDRVSEVPDDRLAKHDDDGLYFESRPRGGSYYGPDNPVFGNE